MCSPVISGGSGSSNADSNGGGDGSDNDLQVISASISSVITILHTNDIHAHFEEFNRNWQDCSSKDIAANECFGGVARISHLVDEIRSKTPNILFFDAGDQFVGTNYFKYFKASIIAEWMNSIKYDLMVRSDGEVRRCKKFKVNFSRQLVTTSLTKGKNTWHPLFRMSTSRSSHLISTLMRLLICGPPV